MAEIEYNNLKIIKQTNHQYVWIEIHIALIQ